MQWSENQKTNMRLLLADVEGQWLQMHKKRRLGLTEKRGGVPPREYSKRRRTIEWHLARFYSKMNIKSESECWGWRAARSGGRGRFNVSGCSMPAYRVSFWLERGPFNLSLFICHRCDNPNCCNPAHLFAGSHDDNVLDAMIKGRIRCGDAHVTRILTEAEVAYARAAHIPYKRTIAMLAKELGVKFRTLRDAVEGVNWRSVPLVNRALPKSKNKLNSALERLRS